MYVGFNKNQRFRLLAREKQKFLNIPPIKQSAMLTQESKKYIVKTAVKVRLQLDKQNVSWFHKFLESARKFHLNSIRPGSKKSYSTGQIRWFAVAEKIGTDPLMRMIPKEWEIRVDCFKLSTLTWYESCMLAFLASCRDPEKAVIPNTAFAYLSAVRKFLEENGIDTKFFESSQYIRNTKMGMVNAYRVESNSDARDSERLAITIDTIVGFDAHTREQLGSKYGLAQLAVHTAQILGYTTLSRVSEYLQTPGEAEHLLLAESIMFETHSKQLIPSTEIDNISWSEIQGCVVDILSAKNDKKHKGNRLHFGLADLADPNQAYCITKTLWKYAKAVRPVKGMSFFYIPGLKWTLKPRYFNLCLKQLAVLYNLDPARISSHSLRIGGASALAAAGVPDYLIMDMGRWRSLTFLTYVRRSTQMFDTARNALARRDLLTVNQIRLMNPKGVTSASKLKKC